MGFGDGENEYQGIKYDSAWDADQARNEDRRYSEEYYAASNSSSDSGGCLGPLVLGGLILAGALGVGAGTGVFSGDDTPDFREASVWDGRYECGEDAVGLRVTTQFTGAAEDGVAPMTVDVVVFENPPETIAGQATGERLGRFERTATFSDGTVTLDEVPAADDAERFEPTAGRLRIRSNGAKADTMSGRMRAPGCDTMSAVQSS